jgi:LPXTG-motif cell wall-anchored protein
LLTAAAAGSLLCALWFVPSANATPETSAGDSPSAAPSPQVTEQARPAVGDPAAVGGGTRLADTGSFDSTPYVIGGTAFLSLGAGFVAYSVRRERLGF